MVDLGDEATVGHGRVQNVVHIHGQHLEEALAAGSRDGVGSVLQRQHVDWGASLTVVRSPRVRSVGACAVGKLVKHTLVRVLLGAKEDEAGGVSSDHTHNTHCSRV